MKLRYRDYPGALQARKDIISPEYTDAIKSFQKAILSYKADKAIPAYYQDGLVALACLKNGYFTIARRIALQIVMQDPNYILPYQILAYSHFLTNNRDTAIQYFLKLADIDESNSMMYKFLIGVSLYRNNDSKSALLYLNQVNIPKLTTDVYRYQILSDLQIQDEGNLLSTRQNLLGQADLESNDFYEYFYNVLYKGYFSQDTSRYTNNPLIADKMIENCEALLSGGNMDICTYGKVGKAAITKTLSTEESDLIHLASTYHQSYMYHLLGDYYQNILDTQKEKEAYTQALSFSHDPEEVTLLKDKITAIDDESSQKSGTSNMQKRP